ncbi:MAG: glycosyltransferase family 4 protein [Cyanobacteria bacterium P01_A01_bin.83]
MRLLITSNLDSNEPFGSFTRPFYLGKYLTQHFEVCQLGLNCSAIDYAPSVSVNSRSFLSYIQAIQTCIDDFEPDIIYAQQNLAGIASLFALILKRPKKCSLVFDFHSVPAFEHWTLLSYVPNRAKQLARFLKAYIAQGSLILANRSIVIASESISELITQWYRTKPQATYCVANGVTSDLLEISNNSTKFIDPYHKLRPAKIVLVIAPKVFGFPSNDLSVSMTLQVAKNLETRGKGKDIHFVVIGRDGDGLEEPLPSNVTFTGFLPKRSDFLAHLVHADVGLLPFSQDAVAGGARNKALDYLACKTLVVSTPEGIRGLEEFRDHQHLLLSGYTVEEVANTVVDACTNRENYQSLVEEAYQLIEAKYSWSAMAEKVAGILNKEKISE